jgi:hypothetical protein
MTKLALLALSLAAPAAAIAADNEPQLDPNEVICQTVRVTGSRLAMSRRCATRAQWLEDQRQQRAQLNERTLRQVNPQGMSASERAFANGRSVNVGTTRVPQ